MTSTNGTIVMTCKFPGCTEPVAKTDKPGRPTVVCSKPEHTALRAWNAQKKLDTQAVRAAASQPDPVDRPVTQGTETPGELIRRLEELRREFAATLDDAGELIATIADPRSVAEEIDQVRRECARHVDEALAAQVAAERAAAEAETERRRARKAEELANSAAEEAVAVESEAIERLARVMEESERQVAAALAERNSHAAADAAARDASTACCRVGRRSRGSTARPCGTSSGLGSCAQGLGCGEAADCAPSQHERTARTIGPSAHTSKKCGQVHRQLESPSPKGRTFVRMRSVRLRQSWPRVAPSATRW